MVQSYDVVGLYSSDTSDLFSIADDILPQITILEPSSGFSVSEYNDITIRWQATDNIGMDSVRIYYSGDPLDPNSSIGSLVSKEHAERVKQFIKKAKSETELVFEGGIKGETKSNNFVSPTIFRDNTGSKEISVDEVFGPVLSVIPFKDENEAISIANNSMYALAASVWTDDLSQAHRVSDKVHAGTVSVNTMDALSPMTPFGGFKQSGFGNDLSLHSFDKYTGLKTVWIKY